MLQFKRVASGEYEATCADGSFTITRMTSSGSRWYWQGHRRGGGSAGGRANSLRDAKIGADKMLAEWRARYGFNPDT